VKVTIAGAGVIGCAIAYELAARGAHVRVLDSRGPAGGATRASAGILAPYIEGHDPILRKLGVRSLALYDEFHERVRRDSGIEVEYERRGTLQVALNLDEGNRLKRAARSLGAAGIGHALLDSVEVRRCEPALTAEAVAGLEIREQGYVAPADLTRAVAAAAIRHGATFELGSVLTVEGAEVARLQTSAGVIESDALIVAAGSWSTTIGLERPNPRSPIPDPPSLNRSAASSCGCGCRSARRSRSSGATTVTS
jgi:glycine oxidase